MGDVLHRFMANGGIDCSGLEVTLKLIPFPPPVMVRDISHYPRLLQGQVGRSTIVGGVPALAQGDL